MNFDCSDIRDHKQSFDISALGSPISVMTSVDNAPSPTLTNTTFTIDICKPLDKAKGIPKEEDCENGTQTIPIAGQYPMHGGTQLDPVITRLKTSSSPSDRKKEGFRVELHGQKYPARNGKPHKAVIEFLCQDKVEEKGERDLVDAIKRREKAKEEDDGGEEEDHSATGEVADDGHGGRLKYIDFDLVDDTKVLSLEWKTKYACENFKGGDDGSSKSKSSRWGFFTWLIIMYVFHFPLPPSHHPPFLTLYLHPHLLLQFFLLHPSNMPIQYLPRNSCLPDIRLVAQLQPLFGPRMGSGAPFRDHQGYPIHFQGLDEESA
ncbi:MAG: hypothetical protein Q9184_002583 [Pyrenodesmia sp. 2 TL-2023]